MLRNPDHVYENKCPSQKVMKPKLLNAQFGVVGPTLTWPKPEPDPHRGKGSPPSADGPPGHAAWGETSAADAERHHYRGLRRGPSQSMKRIHFFGIQSGPNPASVGSSPAQSGRWAR